MPKNWTTEVEAAAASRQMESAWLFDFYVLPDTLRCWDKYGAITVDDEDYESMAGRIRIEGEMRSKIGLSSEPLIITMDGSDGLDDATPGEESVSARFLDSTWSQRKVRIRQILFTPGTSHSQQIGIVREWNGYLDFRTRSGARNRPTEIEINCESGTFFYNDASNHTRTYADQQLFSPGDLCFERTPTAVKETLPWWKRRTAIPGRGGSGGSGGGRIGGPGGGSIRIQ
ncbi:hypothetical protein [Euryhalocaulis caribicus]|uniref:hypothetical protein n=1 Tax=Euryhalocaulis caribicus TaxID=1161401 RepID=UPI0003A949D2|nr:hypothetical protein [Euryhalocaulis caribicus]